MNKNNQLTIFADSHCCICENPLWNNAEQMLYWKGSEGQIYRKPLDSLPNVFECLHLGIGIGGMAFTRNNALLLFAEHGRVWRWVPGQNTVLIAELPRSTSQTFFNDVIVDPLGRVFCGVLAENFFDPAKRAKHGSLWRLDTDGTFHCMEQATGTTPNGMGFSPDQKQFYFAVSDEQTVYSYNYDSITGNLSNRKTLINQCGVDGMTVDAEGCLWVAHWGGPLVRYSPEGQKLLEYCFPANVRAISSVTFGGANYRTIFVTTTNYPKDVDSENFSDGGVFKLEQDICGTPEFASGDIII